MRVSCILPVFNGEKFLGETLESLVRQRVPFAEIIVIDDGSTDATPFLLEKWKTLDSRIKVLRFDGNLGVSHARNTGVNLARSDWCLLMDADDLAHPDLLICYRNFLQQLAQAGERADLLFCSSIQIDESGRTVSMPSRFVDAQPHEMMGYLLVRNPIVTTSGVMVKRDAFLQLGGFHADIRYGEDWELWLRLADRYSIRYLDQTLIQVRRHPENASAKIERMIESELNILQSYDLDFIRQKIMFRNVPHDQNVLDFTSVAFRLGLWEEGLRHLHRLQNPSEWFFFFKGLYAVHRGDYAEARDWFEKTLGLNPKNMAAGNNLACCIWLLGQRATAVSVLGEIHEALPAYVDASENLENMKRNMAADNGKTIAPKFTWRPLRSVLTVYRNPDSRTADS